MYRFAVQEKEQIIRKGLTSLQIDDATLSGALYLTTERLVFVGHLLGGNAARKELSLRFDEIATIGGARTAFIIPNAIDIVTKKNERLRFVLRDRAEWLSAMLLKLENQ